jgi:transposase
MPAGRPTDYRPEYCDDLVHHMNDGFSFESFAGKVGNHHRTLYDWAEAHPEFLQAKRRGEDLARIWWEGTLKRIAVTNEGNATATIFALKNKFPAEWRDRQQHEHTGEGGGPVIFQTIYEADKREGK